MSLIKLLKLNSQFYTYFFIAFFLISFALAEDKPVDIWANQENKKKEDLTIDKKVEEQKPKINLQTIEQKKTEEIKILETNNLEQETKLIGLYEPEENDLNLNMWSRTNGELIVKAIKRIEKIDLSDFSEKIFLNTILTYSYPPDKNLSENEFMQLKIDWLIKNKKIKIIENFLNNNTEFQGKSKLIKYLVDFYISSANISEGCKKADFINKEIKNNYLEKFRIYCLILNEKKEQAQLNFDLLREEGRVDKFFENKILFLLGLKDKVDNKISDKNLLNFYLSSITVEEFSYEPTNKTDENIWRYLVASNLIVIDKLEDPETIKKYEIAANNGTFKKDKIFEIYMSIPFNINQLINATQVYQALEGYEGRALIYQKILLSDDIESKLRLLFLLKDLFEKEKLDKVFKENLSNTLKEIEISDIPDDYKNLVEKNILEEKNIQLGKIKYDDKVLHRSKVIKVFTEDKKNLDKINKDFLNVYKKIKKNSKYFYSIKDIILLETLSSDGIKMPKDLDIQSLSKDLTVPSNMKSLVDNGEIGLLMLKLVEIIGSDDIQNLDPETLYFINSLLNKGKIKKVRNEILNLTLPLRI